MIKNFIWFILITLLSFSCKKNDVQEEKNRFPKVEINSKKFNFGKISQKDTVLYTFLIKNTSEVLYKIDTVGVSCGCTYVKSTKDSVGINDFAEIVVKYIPNSEDTGFISKSIVVKDNSEATFNTFYLEGEVLK